MKSFVLLLKSFIPSVQHTTRISFPKLYILFITSVGLKKHTGYPELLNCITLENVINPNLANVFMALIIDTFPFISIGFPFIVANPI